MPGRKPTAIELSEKERQALAKLAARHTTGQQKAQRARIILKAAEGKNHAEIARELKVSIDRATLWRARWLALADIGLDDLSVEERLDDLPRPGAPSRLSADQVCQMEQMAWATEGCTSAREGGTPHQPVDRPRDRGRVGQTGHCGVYLPAPRGAPTEKHRMPSAAFYQRAT